MYTVFGKTYRELDDFVPPIPARARQLKPGEALHCRWVGGRYVETIERTSPPLPGPPVPSSRPADPPSGEVGYLMIPRGQVPHRLRVRAEGALRLARDALLRGREPGLFFYRFARAGERPDFTQANIVGVARPWSFEIGVRIDGATRPADVAETIYHECGHLANLPEDQCERLARDLVLQGL